MKNWDYNNTTVAKEEDELQFLKISMFFYLRLLGYLYMIGYSHNNSNILSYEKF